ncbi:hypothetical protein H312_00214 [Anncaliia algerae PRA339]|uniref:Uncharacterized protein n=1 Tax=Anncaliia algerae PRA339 TaxID=1288291 RepID=A0A059F5G5_9MICR|nr:hypothetical protein H312_00214 [Anncaliia algerae PRA339]
MNYSCSKYKTTKSIKENSFFDDFRLPVREVLKCIYSYTLFNRQVDIHSHCGLSKNFTIKLRSKLILKFKEFFDLNPIKLGGPGSIVHVDETKLNFNVKSHRGYSPAEPSWAIVFTDTGFTPARGYVELVENRTADTLLAVINRIILPQST